MSGMHGTCVVIEGVGVLIRGPSGSGKSDLALRLLDRGALLVADDYVDLTVVNQPSGPSLCAQAPAPLAGLLEVRGLGIIRLPSTQCAHQTSLGLVVDLLPPGATGAPERLPEPSHQTLVGVSLPSLSLAGLEASTPAKVALAARLRSTPPTAWAVS